MCEKIPLMPRTIYSLVLYLLLPFTPLKLLWRGIKQPEYREHIAERYGFYGARQHRRIIWLHCVSLGETRAAAPLIQSLILKFPQHRILLTHATPTGREAGEQLFGDQVDRVYLPYDTPDAVARFLDHFRPEIGLLMETELWFNLIANCKSRDIPILLVNARLSARSAKGYAKVARLTREGLQNLTAIAAQTEQDAERLMQLGADEIMLCGNLKFDVKPPEQALAQGQALRRSLSEARPVFLAASTRDGEEALILEALEQVTIPGLLTVIVPRHPQRFDEVANLLSKRGLSYIRKSVLTMTGLPIDSAYEVVLGDTMGEMFTYYAACDVALIGGSLLSFGGQNLIEACAMGKPVIIGKHTFNFDWVAEEAVRKGAAIRVGYVDDLAASLTRLFSDTTARQKMGEAGYEFSQGAVGANRKILELVERFIATDN